MQPFGHSRVTHCSNWLFDDNLQCKQDPYHVKLFAGNGEIQQMILQVFSIINTK